MKLKNISAATFIALIVTLMAAVSSSQLSAQKLADSVGGLIQEEGWQTVQANCTECHSAQMIIQNSGSRAVWKSRILWMQETQGLGELSGDTENAILIYLANNYGPKEASRRSGLAVHLMPANPLESTN
jgi:cytochrome c5